MRSAVVGVEHVEVGTNAAAPPTRPKRRDKESFILHSQEGVMCVPAELPSLLPSSCVGSKLNFAASAKNVRIGSEFKMRHHQSLYSM